MSYEVWKRWDDVHKLPDQQKRITSAKKAENTPLDIDSERGYGFFSGSHGRYETHLDNCKCADFIRRKLPCKHMYRLAIELGVFGGKEAITIDETAVKVPKRERDELVISIVSKLENYPDEEQQEIKQILLDILYHKQNSAKYQDASVIKNAISDGLLVGTECYSYFIPKILKRDMVKAIKDRGDVLPDNCKLAKDIADWMIAHRDVYGPILLPNCMEVRLSGELQSVSLSVYKYLHRKFDESVRVDHIFNPETESFEKVEKNLPIDFETSLLDLFGTNPLKK